MIPLQNTGAKIQKIYEARNSRMTIIILWFKIPFKYQLKCIYSSIYNKNLRNTSNCNMLKLFVVKIQKSFSNYIIMLSNKKYIVILQHIFKLNKSLKIILL